MPSKSLFIRILIIASLLLVNLQRGTVSASPVGSETQSIIYYVKPSANGDCFSWSTACELQTALFNATDSDQIWVASGTYKPTTSSNRNATFQLKSGVAIYGGFPIGGGGWAERDWDNNITILSGDVGVIGNSGDNSYHVVTGNGVNGTAVLDGFTISGGKANISIYYDDGAGFLNINGNPTLSNITFSGNSALSYGGGMYNSSSSPTLTNVTFLSNSAVGTDINQGLGGGMYNENNSNPTLTNITFIENSAERGGGGMYNINSSPKLTNVIFTLNTASGGGGIFNDQSDPILRDVSFTENSAIGSGGGMYNINSSPKLTNVIFALNSSTLSTGGGIHNYGSFPTLLNVTFFENSAATNGGGMYNNVCYPTLTNVTFTGNVATSGGGVYNENSTTLTMSNSIIWGNTPDQIYNRGSSALITFSDIQGGYTGTGNINADPLLGNLADNGGFSQTLALGDGSPAIDAGNPEVCPVVDQRAYSRPIDGDNDGVAICDMGAYEYNSFPAILTLTIDVVGGGLVVANPEKADYYYGEVVTLTAIADSDWVFNGWGGDVSSMENPLTITMYDDTSITANFMFNAWVLTVSVYPEGAGTVSLNPDTPTYPYMSYVSATAIPNPGWTFAGWSGDVSGTTNPITVTMTSHKSITANFSQNEYSLNVTVNPEGVGSVAISPSKPNYHYGETVTLTATPVIGWRFISWSGDATGATNPLEVIITGTTNVTANFSNQYTLFTSVLPEGSGTITRDIYQDTYEYGTVVTLTAVPVTGWSFAGWSGDATGTDNPLTFSIEGNTSIVANFTQDEYTLTVGISPADSGTVSVDPVKDMYHYGDVVTLTATPNDNWLFDSWSGDVNGTENPLTVTIEGNANITTNFIVDEWSLNVSVTPEGMGSVTVDPLKENYQFGDEVTLSASAISGWSFAGWSGDAEGMDNPYYLTMHGDTSIVANFTQDEYVLTIAIEPVDSGSVSVTPVKDTFHYGDEVTLTAIPGADWSFGSWSGDLNSLDNPFTFTMTRNTNLSANFNRVFRLYMPLITRN